ncbi:MAG TPA: energy transducer TonB [Candidatus Acidoferrum sp.]|nr:energy transducer TonB [Candidatus Acidoferrum sp.]
MNLESKCVPEASRGFLNDCLVEGDPAGYRLLRKTRRGAMVLSILLQTIAILALILFPLLGKGEHIPVRIFVARPPFPLGTNYGNPGGPVEPPHGSTARIVIRQSLAIPGRASTPDGAHVPLALGEPPGIVAGPVGTPDGDLGGPEIPQRGPSKPETDERTEPHRLQIGHIDPARLIRRLEPIYPPLGKQLGRETRVELRAIIATDGSIQSLEVLSGDPLFYPSAIDAVSRWQYTPTILDGQPVEIDTQITVIYSLHR